MKKSGLTLFIFAILLNTFLSGQDKKPLSQTDFDNWKDLYEEILETQYIQKTRDELIVKIVAIDKYTSESEKKFEKEIRKQVGNLIKLKFIKVSKIPKTMRGKHRLIISEIEETQF